MDGMDNIKGTKKKGQAWTGQARTAKWDRIENLLRKRMLKAGQVKARQVNMRCTTHM